MQMADIRREKTGSVVVEPLTSVISEASEVLGYTVDATPSPRQTRLREALAKLEIEPLNEVDVVRYQAESIAELMLSSEFVAEAVKVGQDYRFYHYWASVELTKYHEPVPEFVLAKAVQIKKEMPEVQFFVQSLEGDPDPFLLAKDGYNDHAYIEVWAEPKFEGRISLRG